MIVTLPFATRLVTEGGRYQVAVVLYALIVAGVDLSLALLMWQVWRRGMQRPGTPASVPVAAARGLVISSVAFLLSIPIAFVNTTAAKYSWLVFSAAAIMASRLIQRLRRNSIDR